VPKVSVEHKEHVRKRLLDAARRVVLRDGHEGATTRAILDEAGMSAGSLYNYFSSKAELFETLAEQVVRENLPFAVGGGGDRGDALVRFATEQLTRPDLPALAWFRGRMTADADVRAALAKFNASLVESFEPLVAAAQADGALRDDVDAAALVELVDVIYQGLNQRAVMGTFVTSFERVGRVAVDLLQRGLIGERTSRR